MAPQSVRTRRSSFSWSSDPSLIGIKYSPSWEDQGEVSSGRSAEDDWDIGDRSISSVETAKIGSDESESSAPPTPRSRRTLRRTTSAEPRSTSLQAGAPAFPALDTIFSPTHEILHPMHTLRLKEELVSDKASSAGCQGSFSSSSNSVKAEADFILPKPLSVPETDEVEPGTLSTRSLSGDDSKVAGADCSLPLVTQKDHGIDSRQAELSIVPGAKRNGVVVIVDAEKKATTIALDWALADVVQPGDEIVILGVLKHIRSPMGHKMLADVHGFSAVNELCLEMEMETRTEAFEKELLESGRRQECENKNVKITVKIAPGANPRAVVVRELTALQATWAIFDRKVMKDRKFYGKHLRNCSVVRMRRNGRSAETICLLASATPGSWIPTSEDTSSMSSFSTSDSTTSSRKLPNFWSRIIRFQSTRHRSLPCTPRSRSSSGSPSPGPLLLPSTSAAGDSESFTTTDSMTDQNSSSFSLDSPAGTPTTATDHLSPKLKSFYLGLQAADDSSVQPPDLAASCALVEAFLCKQAGLDAAAHRREASASVFAS